MTLEELLREGAVSGIPLWTMEEMTWGEVVETVLSHREKERRAAQRQAIVAYQQAGLIARALTEGKLPEIYEVFPFWEEEEIKEMKVEKYRSMMERYAAAGRAVKERA